MGKKLNEPDLLAELLALRPDLVQRFARLRCGRADADDLAQNTLIRGVRSLHTYRSEGELRRWAMGVANNVYRRHRRTVRRRNKVIVTEPEAAVEAFAPGPSPDVSAQLGEARERLYAAVDAMPDVLFEVFFLVYLEEYTLEEARKELRISKNAVKMRALRVRRYLRKEMRDFRDAYYSVVPPMPPSGPLALLVQRAAPMLGHMASVLMAALLPVVRGGGGRTRSPPPALLPETGPRKPPTRFRGASSPFVRRSQVFAATSPNRSPAPPPAPAIAPPRLPPAQPRSSGTSRP
ncbi:RNA polymerase sigma factor [Polyangium jinanense]|uniref:RNA polymerase sigma factor n=1 Tax=Polyangium jinanense TaxID=2829994 RepID=A0A9X3X6G3_9BACT|nr:RNA polymerase sigma factor [Polyangium jinanense]MDC3960695.1 RNA polymerase sigma factor [Polyangium jinanense]MDC3984527.1 RNA polymerase sigma factor [Polyangium jinanense]